MIESFCDWIGGNKMVATGSFLPDRLINPDEYIIYEEDLTQVQ